MATQTANRRRPLRRTGDVTFEEFCTRVRDGEKADLLNGAIYMASPDNTEAGGLNAWLAALLYTYVDYLDLGRVFQSRVAFKIGKTNGPEPDIAFVPKAWLDRIRRGYILGAPGLAVEIVSPDSVFRDYVEKLAAYEAAGVQEYWIVDPDESRAVFYVRKGTKLRETKPVRGVWKSQVVPGFAFEVAWLWLDSRPKVWDVLQPLIQRATQPS